MSGPSVLDAALEERIRAIVGELMTPPELVHQRTVERWAGVPARDYLRHARAEDYLTWKDRRLVYARTADVIAFFKAHISMRAIKPGNDHNPEAIAFSRVGARRVGK